MNYIILANRNLFSDVPEHYKYSIILEEFLKFLADQSISKSNKFMHEALKQDDSFNY